MSNSLIRDSMQLFVIFPQILQLIMTLLIERLTDKLDKHSYITYLTVNK